MPLARQFWARRAPDRLRAALRNHDELGRGRRPWDAGRLTCRFDIGRDLLTARGWLERAGLRRAGRAAGRPRWWRPRGRPAVAARAVPPAQRAAWAATARAAAAAGHGGAGAGHSRPRSRASRFEWAAASAYATDALLDGTLTARRSTCWWCCRASRPSRCRAPCCEQLRRPGAGLAAGRAGRGAGRDRAACGRRPADEAERAAACVLRHLRAGPRAGGAGGHRPRADAPHRRACWSRAACAMRDETGWKLSTTRAAAHVMAALRACAWDAASDAVLDWLKNAPALAPGTVQALERRVRRAGLREWRLLRAGDWATAPRRCAGRCAQVDGWRERHAAGARACCEWLRGAARAAAATPASGTLLRARRRRHARCWRRCACDEAGAARLDAWPQAQRRIGLREFTAWANEVLEAASFVPPHAGDEQVVVLPLSQLLGQPFAALVLPGCDERSLPASPEPPGGWTQAQRRLLGLPSREDLEAAQRAAWRSALQAPRVRRALARQRRQRRAAAGQPAGAGAAARRRGAPARTTRATRARSTRSPCRAPAVQAAALVPSRSSPPAPTRTCAAAPTASSRCASWACRRPTRSTPKWTSATSATGCTRCSATSTRRCATQRAAAAPSARACWTPSRREGHRAGSGLGEGEFLPFAAAWPRCATATCDWLAKHEAHRRRVREAESEHEVQLGAAEAGGPHRPHRPAARRQPAGDGLQDRGACRPRADRMKAPLRGHAAGLLRRAAARRHAARRLRQRRRARRDEDRASTRPWSQAARPAGARASWHDVAPHRRRARRCPRWARARSANSARRAACAAGISGVTEARRCRRAPAYEHNGARVRARALLRHRLRSAPQRGGGGLRRRRQDLDAGVAHPARAAGGRAAARDPGDHLHQEGRRRDAPAPARVAGSSCAHARRPRCWRARWRRAACRRPTPRTRAALQGLYARAAGSGRPVQIRTFHSWFAALLRSAPLAVLQSLGLPAHYELLEDDSEAVALRLAALPCGRGSATPARAPTSRPRSPRMAASDTQKALAGRAGQAGGVRAGRRARRGRRLGAAVRRACSRSSPAWREPERRCCSGDCARQRWLRRAPARSGARERTDLLGQGRASWSRPSTAGDLRRGALRRRCSTQKERAAQVQRQARRLGAGARRAGTGAAPVRRRPPARGLAAPPAHGAPGAPADRGVRGAQARARLGGHERRRARRARACWPIRCCRAGCRSGSTRACGTC